MCVWDCGIVDERGRSVVAGWRWVVGGWELVGRCGVFNVREGGMLAKCRSVV